MMNRAALIGTILSLGVVLSVTSSQATAQMIHQNTQSAAEQTGQFHRVEQPLWAKVAVTTGGLGLIGLELWWFLLSKPRSRKATTEGGIQEVTVTVDGGYEPNQIVVHAGQPVRLNFDRKDPSNCLEEVRFPDFHIAQALPLNRTTTIEFTPDKPGRYEFTCGMNMFRGVVEVQSTEPDSAIATASAAQQTHHPVHSAEHSAYHTHHSTA